VENLVNAQSSVWAGRPVFVTGHTGFKGGWLATWLHRLGASIHGYAIDPPTEPSLFHTARISSLLGSDTRADLADIDTLRGAICKARPEVIFHLAAQPLVREGYRNPLGTMATNVMGTAHVLEAARAVDSLRAILVITTDKVYENRGSLSPYTETDPLGGCDPYSASKAAAEFVAASYRASFFSGRPAHSSLVATARAGNVIGGGDWAADRLVPDCLRAFSNNRPVHLRHPRSVRPWQHVLEPLAGYLQLAECLLGPGGEKFARAWNFGPDDSSDATVREVAQSIAHLWGDNAHIVEEALSEGPHEHELLKLESHAARTQIGWRPRWSLQQSIERTIVWHRAWCKGADMVAFTLRQILDYEATSTR
jgi:CDP-glucose 4,6-dehydratase